MGYFLGKTILLSMQSISFLHCSMEMFSHSFLIVSLIVSSLENILLYSFCLLYSRYFQLSLNQDFVLATCHLS